MLTQDALSFTPSQIGLSIFVQGQVGEVPGWGTVEEVEVAKVTYDSEIRASQMVVPPPFLPLSLCLFLFAALYFTSPAHVAIML
jgi:hypothetical protein